MEKVINTVEDIKQKITDCEYKTLMDNLKIVHDKKESNNLYELKFIHQTIHQEFETSIYPSCSTIKCKIQKRIVKVEHDYSSDRINQLCDDINNHNRDEWYIRLKSLWESIPTLTFSETISQTGEYIRSDPDDNDNEDNETFIKYTDIIPLSIKKYEEES